MGGFLNGRSLGGIGIFDFESKSFATFNQEKIQFALGMNPPKIDFLFVQLREN